MQCLQPDTCSNMNLRESYGLFPFNSIPYSVHPRFIRQCVKDHQTDEDLIHVDSWVEEEDNLPF